MRSQIHMCKEEERERERGGGGDKSCIYFRVIHNTV
jgi:hypothetical protein